MHQKTDQELRIANFKAILTDHEKENGEIPGMYREPRGSIYHPHRDDDIPLGTLTVEEYERPVWTFNKLVYIEKEGFSEALKDNGWPERHDCALLSSKGFTTRAARDLVDKLAEHASSRANYRAARSCRASCLSPTLLSYRLHVAKCLMLCASRASTAASVSSINSWSPRLSDGTPQRSPRTELAMRSSPRTRESDNSVRVCGT